MHATVPLAQQVSSSSRAPPHRCRALRWPPAASRGLGGPGAWRLLLPDALLTRPSLMWRTARELLGRDLRELLGEIRAPTLVLWGADDPLLPAADARVFRSGIAGARLLLLPRAGHLPMLTRPDEFKRAIVAFLGGEPVGE